MDIMILEYIDDIEHGSLISEYEVIQSLCDSYIKQIHMNQFVLEDGESKPDDGKKKDSDKGSTSKPPSFLEKAINFVKRIVLRIKSFFNTKKLKGYRKLLERNLSVFMMKSTEIFTTTTAADGDDAALNPDETVFKDTPLYFYKKKIVSDFIVLINKMTEDSIINDGISVISYNHDTNYAKKNNDLNKFEKISKEFYEKIKEIDKGITGNYESLKAFASEHKDVFIKYQLGHTEDDQDPIAFVYLNLNTLEEFGSRIYIINQRVEKEIKTGKEIEKLYSEFQDKDNLSFYSRYITRYVALLDRIACGMIKFYFSISKIFKAYCDKFGIKNMGEFKQTIDPITGALVEDPISIDQQLKTTKKDLKKNRVSGKDWKAAT